MEAENKAEVENQIPDAVMAVMAPATMTIKNLLNSILENESLDKRDRIAIVGQLLFAEMTQFLAFFIEVEGVEKLLERMQNQIMAAKVLIAQNKEK